MKLETKLRHIHSLMNRKLSKIQLDKYFDIAMEENRKLTYVSMSDNFFFQKLCDVVFESGLKAIVWERYEPEIRRSSLNYNVMKAARFAAKNVDMMLKNPKMLKNRKKIEACIHNAKEIVEVSRKCGGFWKWLDSETIKDDWLVFPKPELFEKIRQRFKMTGYTNTYAFLRYVGFDLIKPDVNVKRILYRLGLVSSTKNNKENFKQIQEIGIKMAKATGEKVTTVDYVLYLYGSGGLYFKHPICTEVKPRCDECPLTKHCNFHKAV